MSAAKFINVVSDVKTQKFRNGRWGAEGGEKRCIGESAPQ